MRCCGWVGWWVGEDHSIDQVGGWVGGRASYLELGKGTRGVREEELRAFIIVPSQEEGDAKRAGHFLLVPVLGEVQGEVAYPLVGGWVGGVEEKKAVRMS